MRVTVFVIGVSLALWVNPRGSRRPAVLWLGPRSRPDTSFPDAIRRRGWQQICFFYARVEETAAILNAHPDIVPGSATS